MPYKKTGKPNGRPKLDIDTLTQTQRKLMRCIIAGAVLDQDPKHPDLIWVSSSEASYRTKLALLRGLAARGLVRQAGPHHLMVEATQVGLAKFGEGAGGKKHGYLGMTENLREALHPTTVPKALEKIAQMRAMGFEDPVDALMAIAMETDEEGEFVQPIDIRIDCLKSAAPFVRPKLQAVLHKGGGEHTTHEEWLKAVSGLIDETEANGKVIEHDPKETAH